MKMTGNGRSTLVEHWPYLETLALADFRRDYPTYEDNSYAGYPAFCTTSRSCFRRSSKGLSEEFIDIVSRAQKPRPPGIHAV